MKLKERILVVVVLTGILSVSLLLFEVRTSLSIRPSARTSVTGFISNIIQRQNVHISSRKRGFSSSESGFKVLREALLFAETQFWNNGVSEGSPPRRSLGLSMSLKKDQGEIISSKFHSGISLTDLYQESPESRRVISELLRYMRSSNVSGISQKEGGTQLKLLVDFESGGKALFKPRRFARQQKTLPNHFYFTDFERHTAEIAAYHLDRLLGFRRAVPVALRVLNITADIYENANYELQKTFFVSPIGNLCFHGKCSYYCDTGHAICGDGDILTGSLGAFLPSDPSMNRKIWRHPWRRSYHKRRKSNWEMDPHYCDVIKELRPYNSGRRLLDLIDMSILDFLGGNMDRHHYETFKGARGGGGGGIPLHLDNGRAFGSMAGDETSILAPLYQCCSLRGSTLQRLLLFEEGPFSLGEALRDSLQREEAEPGEALLEDGHFKALNRRLKIVLKIVKECLSKSDKKVEEVIISDDTSVKWSEGIFDEDLS